MSSAIISRTIIHFTLTLSYYFWYPGSGFTNHALYAFPPIVGIPVTYQIKNAQVPQNNYPNADTIWSICTIILWWVTSDPTDTLTNMFGKTVTPAGFTQTMDPNYSVSSFPFSIASIIALENSKIAMEATRKPIVIISKIETINKNDNYF